MREKLETTLAPYADDATVVRELHDVPPYRVYEVRLDDRRAALKIDAHPRGHAADEGRVHDYVANHTAAPVPEVLAVGTDHYLAAWDDTIASASETIDANWARTAGRWLGTLHGETAGDFDGFGRPRDGGDHEDDGKPALDALGTALELDAHAEWVDAVIDRLEYHRTYLESVGHEDVADDVSQFLRRHPNVLDGVGEPVLCHGDVHPEHVVGTGTTSAEPGTETADGTPAATASTADGAASAIDFEHALVAPAEYDYWRTVLPYIDARDDVDEVVSRAFRRGYESVRSLPDDLEQRRPIYGVITAVSALESLFLQRNVGPERRTERAERLRSVVDETLARLRE